MAASGNEHKSTVDGEALRRAMRLVATPVTVVTAAGPDEVRGITIGSFTSVSLDPPLVSFNVQHEAQMYPVISAAERFAVHVMSGEQAYLCNHFSLPDLTGAEQFEFVDYELDRHGTPILDEVVAVLHCVPHRSLEAGDHTIIVGEVVELIVAPARRPLLYYDQTYRQLGREVRSSLFEPVNDESRSTS